MVAGRKLKERERNRGSKKGIIATPLASAGSSDGERPVFSFHHLSDDHSVTICEQREQADVALALERRSQFTWRQLRQMPREKLGYERIRRQSLSAPVPGYFTEDEVPIAFRMADRGRLVGFRQDATFHVVWVDTKLELYAH
jgi:hypothetical protein